MFKTSKNSQETSVWSMAAPLLATLLAGAFTAPAYSAQSPFGGTPWTIPGKIEAENYDLGGAGVAYSDTTSGNAGSLYRSDDVDLWYPGDIAVGTTKAGEWLEYTVNIAATGSYTLKLRAATAANGKQVRILMDGVDITGPIPVNNTGDWQAWQTLSVPVILNAGQRVMRLKIDQGSVNINDIEFVSTAVPVTQSPFGGTPWAIPGIIEAENYDLGGLNVGYYDTTAGNVGGGYRTDDVDLWYANDLAVGTTTAGEWLEYTVIVATTGTYALNLQAATGVNGKQVRILMNGADITGPIAIPNTVAWDNWQTISKVVHLNAGQQVMRLKIDKGSVNINRFVIDKVPEPPAWPGVAVSATKPKTLTFSWSAVPGATYYKLLKDPDGGSGYIQVGANLAITTASEYIGVHLHDWANARYIVEACNSAGCASSSVVNTASAMLKAIGYFKPFNVVGNVALDFFGTSVALSADGQTLAVGVPGRVGVYVFTRTGDTWTQLSSVKAIVSTGLFGASVALSADGNTLAVGAPEEESKATGINGNQSDKSAVDSGAAYIFARLGNNRSVWVQQAYVKASNTDAGDRFGTSVALSADGNTLIVGSPWEDSAATGINGDATNNAKEDAGAVYAFVRTDSAWSQQAYIKVSNSDSGDYLGSYVALSADGNTLAARAGGEDSNAIGINGNQADNSAPSAGAVYVFGRVGGAWGQQAYVKASNTDEGDVFGTGIALSANGNTLAVTAMDESSNATGINGNQADNSAQYAGAAYVFTRTASIWSQQAYIKASNTDAGDRLSSVALSANGNILAVGTRDEASSATGINGDEADNSAVDVNGQHAGAVYLFTHNEGVWSQHAYVKASNTHGGDMFGHSVALSADGGTLAVGAVGEDSKASGINGNQIDNSADFAGAVYLY